MRYIKNITIIFVILSSLIRNSSAQNPNDLYKLSLEQTIKGNYSEALTSIDKSLLSDSTKIDFLIQKATVFYHLNRYDEALRNCYTILKTQPENPQVFILRGLISLSTKSYGGAIFLFGKAIKLTTDKDNLYKAYLNRGKVYMATDKYTEAISDFNAAGSFKPDSMEVLMALSDAYYKIKQPVQALEKALKIIELHPMYANAYKMIGYIYYDKKETEKALEWLTKFCELNPNDASAFQLISTIQLENKNLDKAQLAIGLATRLNSSDPYNFKILATIYIAKGQKEEACNSLFHAFKLGYIEKYGYDLLNLYLSNCESR